MAAAKECSSHVGCRFPADAGSEPGFSYRLGKLARRRDCITNKEVRLQQGRCLNCEAAVK